MRRKQRQPSDLTRPRDRPEDEPEFDGEDIVEYGSELIYAVGYTEGGAPYGVTVAELRRIAERDAGGAPWARAKRVLRELFERETGAVVEVGRVVKLGDGLAREIFTADVDLAPDPHRRSGTYIVALPRPDAEPGLDARTTRELRLVARLRREVWPFRLPEMAGAYPDGDRLALVRRFVPGSALDLRAGRQPNVRPWDVVAKIAAAVHQRPGTLVEDLVPGHATRLAHARAALAVFDGLDAPELRDARAWAEAHVPPAEPSVLLHGDLLGPSILISFDGPPCVIDWEDATRGDPAHDLAIVTRAKRQPFQVPDGLERLLDAYRRHGGAQLTAAEVNVHELCLVAAWYRAALAGPSPHAPAHELAQIRSLLRRLR
jgi:aminoglycoside phosphotransferase (APT) family kinase protein